MPLENKEIPLGINSYIEDDQDRLPEEPQNMNNQQTETLAQQWNSIDIVLLVLKILLWLTLFAFFVEYEFGSAYFVISSMFILFRCTRTDKQKDNKLSAYSVFNKNFERIDGTFTSEQFEKELRYGASSVR